MFLMMYIVPITFGMFKLNLKQMIRIAFFGAAPVCHRHRLACTGNAGAEPTRRAAAPGRAVRRAALVCCLWGLQQRLRRRMREARVAAEIASQSKANSGQHEPRNPHPMNGVIGMLGLLLGTDLKPQQKELPKWRGVAQKACWDWINDIPRFFQDRGRLAIEPIPFACATWPNRWPNSNCWPQRKKGLDLILRVDPQLPEHLIGDPGRIRQVISNLMSNAIKFTRKAVVIIEIEQVAPTDSQAHLRVKVIDTGIG